MFVRSARFSRGIVSASTLSLARSAVVQMSNPRRSRISVPAAPSDVRSVVFHGRRHDTPIYLRHGLGVGNCLVGPAVVEQLDATTLIWPNERAFVDEYGQLILDSPKG